MQANAGDSHGAARTREQALKTAIAIEDASKTANALRRIAALQMANGDTRAAVHTLERALHTAALIRANNSLEYALKAAAIALLAADRVEAGDLPGTLAWAAAHSTDAVTKARALVGAAVALLRPSGQFGSREDLQLLLWE